MDCACSGVRVFTVELLWTVFDKLLPLGPSLLCLNFYLRVMFLSSVQKSLIMFNNAIVFFKHANKFIIC